MLRSALIATIQASEKKFNEIASILRRLNRSVAR